MQPSLTGMAAQQAPAEDQEMDGEFLSEEEMLDLEIAAEAAEEALSEGGYDAVAQAAQSSSNAPVAVGQFLTQFIMQLHESFPPDLNISPKIYLSEGGLLDILGAKLNRELDLSPQIIEEAKMVVIDSMSQIAQQEAQGQQQAAAPAPMPAQPAGGMV